MTQDDKQDCTHPNGYYCGDTNPPTYKCPDCGAYYTKPGPISG